MGVLGQLVSEGDRLRPLQMGESRCGVERVAFRLGGDDGREFQDHLLQDARLVPQVELEVRGHLIVATAARPQPATEFGAEAFQQAPLDRRVDVLVRLGRQELPGTDVGQQIVEAGRHGHEVVVGQ